jgi:ketosteroid isomerase-like protein
LPNGALRDTGQAMPNENVEIVRRSLDAYARRDEAALREIVDVEFELDWSRSIGWLAGVYRGIDEALRFYAGYFEAFREIVVKPDCFIHSGDLVVVPNEALQRGRGGIEVSARSCLSSPSGLASSFASASTRRPRKRSRPQGWRSSAPGGTLA